MAVDHYRIGTALKWSTGTVTNYSGNNLVRDDALAIAYTGKDTYDDIINADWAHITGYQIIVQEVNTDQSTSTIATLTGGDY